MARKISPTFPPGSSSNLLLFCLAAFFCMYTEMMEKALGWGAPLFAISFVISVCVCVFGLRSKQEGWWLVCWTSSSEGGNGSFSPTTATQLLTLGWRLISSHPLLKCRNTKGHLPDHNFSQCTCCNHLRSWSIPQDVEDRFYNAPAHS